MQKNNFSWWYAFIGYGAYLLALVLSTVASSATETILQGANFNTGALFNVLLFVFAGLICLLLLRLVSRNTLTSHELGIHLDAILKAVMIGTTLGLLFFGVSEVVEAYNKSLREASEQITQGFNIGKNFTNDLLLLLSIGLFAPVVEEIVFRGAIFYSIVQGLKRYAFIPCWLALLVALTVSTFAFVFAHGGGGQDAQLGLVALLGILAALAMYLSGSLFAAIAVHAINNNAVFIYMVIKQPTIEPAYSVQLISASLICLLLCLPLGLLLGSILPNKKL